MSRYEAFVFLHVAAAIVWLGAAFALDLLMLKAERARDRARQLDLYTLMDSLANALFIPSSLAVLVFGIALVADGPWSFGHLWVVLGLLGYAASFLVGILFFKPEGGRLGALVAAGGPDQPEVERRVERMNAVSRAELVILFLVVVVMTSKPTADDVWTLAALAVVAAAAVAFAARAVLVARRPAPEAAAALGADRA